MSQLENLVWVTLIGDVDTPAAFQQYVGKTIGLPPDTPLPTQRSDYRLAGVLPGYARQALVSPTPMEWVITAETDRLLTAVDAIPGIAGFTDAAAKAAYEKLATDMRKAGLTRSAIVAGLTTAYRSAVADYQAASAPAP